MIGRRYLIPCDGVDVVGTLTDAIVNEKEKIVIGIYQISNRSVIMECPISDEELSAYKRHPDTFFGIVKKIQKSDKDPLEFYRWVFKQYENTPKSNMLKIMGHWSNYQDLKNMSQKELVKMYAISVTEFASIGMPNKD